MSTDTAAVETVYAVLENLTIEDTRQIRTGPRWTMRQTPRSPKR
jgi:hypothetical protein